MIVSIIIIIIINFIFRSGGHWIYQLRRKTSIYEMAALQGLPQVILQRMMETSVGEAFLGAAIGDAMSINVLMRVLPVALASAGILSSGEASTLDVWRHASAVSGAMPDALYVRKGCVGHLR